MRSNFHPQAYPPRQQYNEAPYQAQTYHRSPASKSNNYGNQQHHTYSHPHIFYTPTSDGNKKMFSSIKMQEDKIQAIDSMMKKKSPKMEKLHHHKTQSQKQSYINTTANHYHDNSTKASEYGMKRDESEPDLRTSCPNIFRKFEQNALRNTMHTNNIQKFGHIMSQLKKQQEEEKNNIKKSQTYTNQPLTPGPRLQTSNTPSYFKKSNIEKPLFKPRTPINQKEKEKEKDRKNLINGFQISRQLGKGKFGEVYLARHADTGFIVALKKIIKSKLKQYKMIEQFKREIKLHSALDHPNIVKFYGFFEHEDNIFLILQYVSGGTLFDYMAEKDILQPKEAVEYLRDTIEALNYMHEKSIAHRDIKPENIVLTVEKVAKLCDFGWSALVQSSRTTYCGTFDYAPPEILERKNYDTGVDIWCIGVLTYEMLTGRVPFQGEKRKQIMEKIVSVDKNKIFYPVDVPDDAKSFIEWLVQKDPTLRPKCKDLLKHPFFINNLKKDKKL